MAKGLSNTRVDCAGQKLQRVDCSLLRRHGSIAIADFLELRAMQSIQELAECGASVNR